ncbi:MAG: zinc ribbon domain-containing protein [Planctomycetes bacterium]|nr:zinc ribbon domain-containing protein [Planctomycetota bacterium]
MPTYEYLCAACGHELELFQNISEAPKKKCPACKRQKLKRKIGGGAGFLFKGSGFYLTDYRSDSYKKGAEAEAKPAEPSSASPTAGEKTPGEKGAGEKKKGATSGGEKKPATPAPPADQQPPKKRAR